MKQPQRSPLDNRLYARWYSMQNRCKNRIRNYGKFGISVCEEWSGKNGFENFKKWSLEHGFNGFLVIDRINTYGDYSPENCRWVTQKENNRNKTNTVFVYDGAKKITLSEYCDIHGLDPLQRKKIYGHIYRERKIANDSSLIVHL